MPELQRVAFFKDINDVDLAVYERRCNWRRFDEGNVAVDFEDHSTDVYFILSGEVRVLIRTASGKEIILGDIGSGQMFGELAAIDQIARSANVTMLTRAEICIMPASVFLDIVHASKLMCDKVMRLLAGRVRELNARVTEYSVFDLKHRLYAELLRLSLPRSGHPGEKILSPPPVHHVLAARIGCRREQISRELTHLAEEGLVLKNRGGLVLLKPQILKARLEGALSAG